MIKFEGTVTGLNLSGDETFVTVDSYGTKFEFPTAYQPCPYGLGDEMTVTFEKHVAQNEKDDLVEAAVLEETLQTLKNALSTERYEKLIERLGVIE